jgi:ribosomal protein L1
MARSERVNNLDSAVADLGSTLMNYIRENNLKTETSFGNLMAKNQQLEKNLRALEEEFDALRDSDDEYDPENSVSKRDSPLNTEDEMEKRDEVS